MRLAQHESVQQSARQSLANEAFVPTADQDGLHPPSPPSILAPALPERAPQTGLCALCLRAVRRHLNVTTALPLLGFSRQVSFPDAPNIERECLRFLENTFAVMLEREGREVLEDVLGSARVAQLLHEKEESVAWKRKKALLKSQGRVLEPQLCAESVVERSSQAEGTSVSGGPAYPYLLLKAGMAWPSDVDPAQREQHLSEADFRDALQGRSPAEFAALPAWKQRRLKLEAELH
eukprot:jgi/Tetstr1/438081/TSEL_026706.t2